MNSGRGSGTIYVIVGEIEFPLTAGKEFFIKKALPTAGFPNRHPDNSCFRGKRAERAKKEGACAPLNYAGFKKSLVNRV